MPVSSSKSMRIYYVAILVTGIFVLSYFREYLFLGINQVLMHDTYKEDSIFETLGSFSKTGISILKWMLSIAFACFIAALTVGILNLIYYPNTYLKTTLFTFLALLILSFICISVGYITNNYDSGYYLARVLLGFTQNPIILLFLIPAIKLSGK